jgi:RNase adapter protein RapZ
MLSRGSLQSIKIFGGSFEHKNLRRELRTTLVFLEAATDMLVRRYSETRRPHPLGKDATVPQNIEAERAALAPIRNLADITIDTSKFTVHELRDVVKDKFEGNREEGRIMIQVTSFGFRHGIPSDSDLVLDVRFLPNPNYIPEFKPLTGRHPSVARYIRSFPQTQEFIARISELLQYLLPHYIREGKNYLTIAFGCTGGQHRSVMMAGEFRKRLAKAGYKVKETHRDMPR